MSPSARRPVPGLPGLLLGVAVVGGLVGLIGGSGCSGCQGDPWDVDGGTSQLDGGFDAGVGPGPVRHLIDRPLFGDLPVENRIFDPTFALPTFAWSLYDSDAQLTDPTLTLRADAPTRTPALRLGVSGTTWNGQTAMGMARGGEAPLFAAVWVSVPDGAVDPDVEIIGFEIASTDDWYYPLYPATDVPAYIDDRGARWVRFEARIEEDLPGWVALAVWGTTPLELTGPTLIQGLPTTGLQVGPLPARATPRPATARKRELARRTFERFAHGQPPPREMMLRRQSATRARLSRIARAAAQLRH